MRCSTQWMCGDGLKAYRFTLEPKPKRAGLRLLRGAANQPELTPLVLAQWKLKSNCINPVKENIVGNHYCACVCVCVEMRLTLTASQIQRQSLSLLSLKLIWPNAF